MTEETRSVSPAKSVEVHAEARVRVRYAETDQMGVVYHANYLVWFELGRVEILRSLGLSYKQFEAEGFMIAVVEATARYKSPARYDDEIAVRTRISALRGSLIKFAYRIVRVEDETLLCEGETTHIVVDKAMTKATLPEQYQLAFKALMDGTATK
ncbi:acyl-CoA thioesterase [Terriglobus saanensis]|uniref:Thioesterase superfamily protein n=1 Tax=Terriglobus saanensis (strain ATCC BAA-1853 / DSM 23119 / SP1PR4) TaxID=401053 RepID=E8V542_TERSS|nr:thioesterase family protein [Terriglobus saanensis]ADV83729.1 thioesterase superfamily protein [Terriglobus saanensis SP1PR4]